MRGGRGLCRRGGLAERREGRVVRGLRLAVPGRVGRQLLRDDGLERGGHRVVVGALWVVEHRVVEDEIQVRHQRGDVADRASLHLLAQRRKVHRVRDDLAVVWRLLLGDGPLERVGPPVFGDRDDELEQRALDARAARILLLLRELDPRVDAIRRLGAAQRRLGRLLRCGGSPRARPALGLALAVCGGGAEGSDHRGELGDPARGELAR
mmetsp:Transcript_16972/g.49857  ORF Transcript_16972/g.49857 Transcript_16972/m.49857 type:complete len:209 (-) Transcript_16972:253-879(-)